MAAGGASEQRSSEGNASEARAAGHVAGDGRKRVPAIEGWFTLDEKSPALIGQRCSNCSTYVFPPTASFCPNPKCASESFDTVELSRRGRIWSYTDARYQPPAPYVACDPYQPFAIAAVELDREEMVVLGQVAGTTGASELAVGMEVELVVDTLYATDDENVVVWKWRPVGAGAQAGGSR